MMSNTLKGMPDMPVPYHQKGFSAQQTYVMHTILWQNNPLKTTFGRLLFSVESCSGATLETLWLCSVDKE